jgi:hypothetical protein
MLMRETAPELRAGVYLIGVSPEAARLPYRHLRVPLLKALRSVEAL